MRSLPIERDKDDSPIHPFSLPCDRVALGSRKPPAGRNDQQKRPGGCHLGCHNSRRRSIHREWFRGFKSGSNRETSFGLSDLQLILSFY